MKKLALALAIALLFSASVWSDSIKLTATTSATAGKVGDVTRPGLLFKFELPEELEKARIDLAYLRFKVEPVPPSGAEGADTAQQAVGLLVRPVLESWTSGSKFSNLSDSSATSPYHANFGRLNIKNGAGKIEITQAVKAWQSGELSNLGLLVYPDE